MNWSMAGRRWWAEFKAQRAARREAEEDRAGMGTAFGLDASFVGWDDEDGTVSIAPPGFETADRSWEERLGGRGWT